MIEKNTNYSHKLRRNHHELYHKHKEHFERINDIMQHLKAVEGIAEEEILEVIKNKDGLKAVPLSIFSSWLAPLESLVVFMKDHLKMTFSEIARNLGRDPRTIWLTYQNAKGKNITLTITNDNFVPLEIFGNREKSILENLSVYLHEVKEMAFREIADLTKKDNRTIWTTYTRAKKKENKIGNTAKKKK